MSPPLVCIPNPLLQRNLQMKPELLIPGFDEVTHQPVEKTRTEWQALMAQAIAAGGRRRVEKGETFIHGPDALLIAYIYANVPAPKPTREAP